MYRDRLKLQALLISISPWIPKIERGAGVTITVNHIPQDGFELVARWGNGVEKRKHYSMDYVLSRPKKKPCDHAKDFLRELLEARGVA